MPDSTEAIALYLGALFLGALCLTLFVLAIRRMLTRQEEVVSTMLERYDHRLAEFAQTLSDALNQTLPAKAPPSSHPTTRASCAYSSSHASRPMPTPPSRS
jgi:hypothetical protein